MKLASPADVALACENRLLKVWPALNTQQSGDWVVRDANGFTKRANSAFALVPNADLDDRQVDVILEHYNKLQLPTVFRLSPLAAPAVFDLLDNRGFQTVEPTYCLYRDQLGDWSPVSDSKVELKETAGDGWVHANAKAYGGIKDQPEKLRAITSQISSPVTFATVREAGQDVGWGLAAVADNSLCLLNLVIDTPHRGHGVGRRLVNALMSWGMAAGATSAYLQTLQNNLPAVNLYQSLGFRVGYSYYHRISQPGAR